MRFKQWFEALAGIEYNAESDESGKIQMNATLNGQPIGYAILRAIRDGR